MRDPNDGAGRPMAADPSSLRIIEGGHAGPATPSLVRADTPIGENSLVAAAREEVRRRSDRRLVLGPDMLAEPVWDMLLDLYLAQAAGRHVAVSSLCIASGVPTTTALRWVRILEKDGLLLRKRDRGDARRSFVTLSPLAREKIEMLLRRSLVRGGG